MNKKQFLDIIWDRVCLNYSIHVSWKILKDIEMTSKELEAYHLTLEQLKETKDQLIISNIVEFGLEADENIQPHTHNDFEKGNCIEINLKELNNEN